MTFTNLTTGASTATTTSYDTAVVSPTSNRLVLLAVGTDNGASAAPTLVASGCNLTFTEIATLTDGGGTRRLSLFRALGNNPTSGVITITKNSSTPGLAWSVTQVSKMSLEGVNGANAIVQSVTNTGSATTSLAVTLASFASVNNSTFGCLFVNANFVLTPGSGFTELAKDQTQSTIQSQYKTTNDTGVDWSIASSAVMLGIAIEVRRAIVAGAAMAGAQY